MYVCSTNQGAILELSMPSLKQVRVVCNVCRAGKCPVRLQAQHAELSGARLQRRGHLQQSHGKAECLSLPQVRKLEPFTAKEHVNSVAPLQRGSLWAILHNLGKARSKLSRGSQFWGLDATNALQAV